MCGSILSPSVPDAPQVEDPEVAKKRRAEEEALAKAEQRKVAAAATGRRSLSSSLIEGEGGPRGGLF